ncbi:MAG: 2,3-bisphosphoglycerate-independent phosphoglycerate mutase [Candidatus Liptonbacteria bacterium]|nr:2,3-bisphosphoglycerate-independent phosphoglycerate mutase [Candidatus Liptonbacteria bacterium]
MTQSIVLVVLDGWGIGRNDESNPIYVAQPKTIAALAEEFPITSLQASGIAVGLPWGEVGNSEVGHLTLGAGKTLYQYYPKITIAIQDKSFFENEALKKACAHARENGGTLHLAGLLTKANVHAALEHVRALLALAEKEKVPAKLHIWADGKDDSPKTLTKLLAELPREKIATLTGRYYAMDRNQNWQLTKAAYDLMTADPPASASSAGGWRAGVGTAATDPLPTIEATYAKGLSEEYLPPIRLDPEGHIKSNDSLIFWNFRKDSVRQIAEAFAKPGFAAFPLRDLKNLFVVTMTPYEKSIPAPTAFLPDTVRAPLGKVLSDCGKNQLRVAEKYKYAHVTYFFNAYEEQPFKGEYRVVVPSLSTSKPEEHPEMQAAAITDRVIEALANHSFDFILANYANPDTMAHTANYEASLAAVRVIDAELARLVKSLPETSTLIITSDHGNIEQVLNPTTGLMESQHDPSPVPFHLINAQFRGRKFANANSLATETMGSLADVAPTILELFGIPQPEEMTGRSLLEGII